MHNIDSTDRATKMSRFERDDSKKTSSLNASKKFTFNKANVEQTSRIPLGKRDYGFLKTTNTATPFPKKADPINPQMLVERLQGAVANSVVSDTTVSRTSSSEQYIPQLRTMSQTAGMSFEMKRKLFQEGEFTITRGQKTSEMHHAAPDFDDIRKNSMKDSQVFALSEMEHYCRAMNIKMTKGYEN
ncbi:hypothetical protein ACLKA6_017904 [Drosophila palustris]